MTDDTPGLSTASERKYLGRSARKRPNEDSEPAIAPKTKKSKSSTVSLQSSTSLSVDPQLLEAANLPVHSFTGTIEEKRAQFRETVAKFEEFKHIFPPKVCNLIRGSLDRIDKNVVNGNFRLSKGRKHTIWTSTTHLDNKNRTVTFDKLFNEYFKKNVRYLSFGEDSYNSLTGSNLSHYIGRDIVETANPCISSQIFTIQLQNGNTVFSRFRRCQIDSIVL